MDKKKNYVSILYVFIIIVISITICTLLFTRCSSGGEGKQQGQKKIMTITASEQKSDEHDDNEKTSLVKLSKNELDELEIEVATAGQATIQKHIVLSGKVIAAPDRIAHMTPRFSGIVKEIRKAIGHQVKKGEVIAIIESNESLVKYKLKSAINGTVIDMHMTLGENTDDDSHNVTVADLTNVWANLHIYMKDLDAVKIGQPVYISTSGNSVEKPGRISYISPVVDEKTRTASARVVLNNKEGKWKPGMFVTANVLIDERTVPLAVRKTAVLRFEGKNVVFVRDKDGFRPQPVILGIQDSKSVEIISGMSKGQKYVAEGVFMLKAELLKESFGSSHSH